MSIEKLQEKIRKMKNPSVVDLSVTPSQIPARILEQEPDYAKACGIYCTELLGALKGIVPAVRFSYGHFALMGDDGLMTLRQLLQEAKRLGYYVLLDGVESSSLAMAEFASSTLLDMECDSLILSAYPGSDIAELYIKQLSKTKALFLVIRNANRSAAQLQDLMTGSRLVHMAAADVVNRLGTTLVGKSGYAQIAAAASATSADSLRTLRSKYKNMFLLVDGYDYPNANAKNCSYAFDKLGHGAVVSVGQTVTCAWKEDPNGDYLAAAVSAAERMRKNLTRYLTIL